MMTLAALADLTGGLLHGSDVVFHGVQTDSREVKPGNLFIAIQGEHRDGHDYVCGAGKQEAAGALVSRWVNDSMPQVVVADTTRALGDLAAHWRRCFHVPVIGITGSNGKTTVTAMVRTVLTLSGHPLAPQASYNNHWGVPLTLLELQQGHTHAIIEMGMNHPGEIDRLTRIAAPDVALINNAAPAHLEGLGTVERVAQAKGEILAGVSPDGIAVLNRDDPNFPYWSAMANQRRTLTFGMREQADLTATDLRLNATGSQFSVRGVVECQTITLNVPGRHNIMNALAALAVCHAVGVSPEDLCMGLAQFQGIPGRLRWIESTDGATVIDDSFNANPSSVKAAIDVLSRQPGRRILVLGAMAELGPAAEELHTEVGAYARSRGVERLLILDDVNNPVLQGYRQGFGAKTEYFQDLADLTTALRMEDQPGHTMLVKGSKSARMGRVVEQLAADQAGQVSC